MSMDCLVRTILEGSRDRSPVVVALSGGVDSSLVALAAQRASPEQAVAVTTRNELVAEREFSLAVEAAAHIGIEHHPLLVNVLEEEDVRRNGENRCYACKAAMFRMMVLEYGDNCLILDGTNADDDPARPGLRALREYGVVSPLKACGLTKQQVRSLAKQEGLPQWDRGSDSCLATRIPVGMPLTREALDAVWRMESFFHQLGVTNLRVSHDNLVATVTYMRQYSDIMNKNRDKFVALIKEIGLKSCRFKEWHDES